jgi:hypothetical protein
MQRTNQLHNQSMTLIREGSKIRFVGESSGERNRTRLIDKEEFHSLVISISRGGLKRTPN